MSELRQIDKLKDMFMTKTLRLTDEENDHDATIYDRSGGQGYI